VRKRNENGTRVKGKRKTKKKGGETEREPKGDGGREGETKQQDVEREEVTISSLQDF
jgi:hypothetical protein